MQVSVESTGNLERRINFSLPAEQLESSISGRLREIARTARIKGFRPGKVPARVIEQRFGEQVKAEVMGGLVRQTLDSAIREHDLRVAGVPRMITNHSGDTITLSAVLPGLAVGVALEAFAGCDRTFATCQSKFGNSLNFGGFPWIPAKNPFAGDSIV